jgi:aldehyde dehydrogenase (NAD+)
MSHFTELSQQYIDGQWRPGSGSWDIVDINPYSGEKLAAITVATVGEVDEAYRAAERAQRRWAAINPYTRRLVFERALRIIEDREQEITATIIAELGGTRLKAGFELSLAKDMLRECMQLSLRAEGRILPSPVDGKENRVYRLPVGVVGVISPFNFPLFLSLKAVAPALALGNGVVLKPHQDEIGDAFIEHPVPKVIAFTGSDQVGRHVATVAAGHFKRTVLELGGNSALIVLDDADLDYAVDAAVFSRFAHQGQVCMAANRVLVDRSVVDDFNARFVAKIRTLTVGDPQDPATDIGPLINSTQADGITAQVDQAVAEGAEVLLRGATVGTLMDPVVLTGVPHDAAILRREIFGPVVVVVPFDGEDEAVEIANDSPFGLSGAVHTGDIERGVRIAQRIETGMIHINDGTIADEPIVPFGGEKNSGVGRLNGDATVDAFTTVKWISIQHGRSRFPF